VLDLEIVIFISQLTVTSWRIVQMTATAEIRQSWRALLTAHSTLPRRLITVMHYYMAHRRRTSTEYMHVLQNFLARAVCHAPRSASATELRRSSATPVRV